MFQTNPFKKAERARVKLRLGIGGPSGSGKTYSALLIASGLGDRIAVIDTEHGSASLYADLFSFDVAELKPPFTPEKYISYIDAAEEGGYDVIIIDSLSHAWKGEGGMLEIHDSITQATGNPFEAWRKVSPMHNRLVERMLQSKAHIIATLRAKQDYVITEDDTGKKMVRKVGLSPIFRDGIEYEFTMYFELTHEHLAVVSKDRTGLFGNTQPFVPTRETGLKIREWLDSGIDITSSENPDYNVLLGQIETMERNNSLTKAELFNWYREHQKMIETLPEHLNRDILEKLKRLKEKTKKGEFVASGRVHMS